MWHANVHTEKIQELLLAQMHPVLEHSSFSLNVTIRLLEQNLGIVIAYQPRAAVKRFNDNMPFSGSWNKTLWTYVEKMLELLIGISEILLSEEYTVGRSDWIGMD
jgi:hypothetical protein